MMGNPLSPPSPQTRLPTPSVEYKFLEVAFRPGTSATPSSNTSRRSQIQIILTLNLFYEKVIIWV